MRHVELLVDNAYQYKKSAMAIGLSNEFAGELSEKSVKNNNQQFINVKFACRDSIHSVIPHFDVCISGKLAKAVILCS